MPTPTYWGLNLTMHPGSPNANDGRFEDGPTLQTASNPNGPWTTAVSPNTASSFKVKADDYLRVSVIDITNTLTSVQMAAVFGRDNARGGGGPKSSPFVSANGQVQCVVPGPNQTIIVINGNNQNAWWTGDQAVQTATGNYRFLIYVIGSVGNVQWQFGHDPEMDVSSQK
jgi:hypothetical protein